jgi:pyridoxamine 5'-phosphate oxidase
MNREQILEFLNAHPACHLATCEGSRPRVRAMMLYRADSSGLIFHTGRAKAVYRQLLANRRVEVCFNSRETQVRIAGVAEIVEDMNLKKEIIESRPFMKSWIEKNGYGLLAVFRVTQCRAAVWTMIATCRQQKRRAFEFFCNAINAHFRKETVPSLLH